MSSIKDYRFLINALASNNDVSNLELARKRFYEIEFENFNEQAKMLKNYYDCYIDICQLMEEPGYDLKKLEAIIDKHFNFFGTDNNEKDDFEIISDE